MLSRYCLNGNNICFSYFAIVERYRNTEIQNQYLQLCYLSFFHSFQTRCITMLIPSIEERIIGRERNALLSGFGVLLWFLLLLSKKWPSWPLVYLGLNTNLDNVFQKTHSFSQKPAWVDTTTPPFSMQIQISCGLLLNQPIPESVCTTESRMIIQIPVNLHY